MAKKKASNQPIVAEEPARPEEQFQLDEFNVAPPSSRPIGPNPTIPGSAKTYGARSARERRTGRTSSSSASKQRRIGGMRADTIADRLEHPTIVVTEEQLRHEYSYVIADLRSMAIVAAVLIVGLIVMAQILPK